MTRLVLLAALVACISAGTAEGAVRAWPPAQVARGSDARLAAGVLHTCYVADDGTIRCWGDNSHGQLGDGTTTDRLLPVSVLTNAVAVSAGDFHTCALLANGGVRCWGHNGAGQLGTGDRVQRLSPAPVVGVADAVAIAAGSIHTCALIADGGVRCWGSISYGQLGSGEQGLGHDRPTPVAVSGLANAVAIAAGDYHTCAVLADSSARCWGSDDFGQLGDDSPEVNRPTPVPVFGARLADIAAGGFHTCGLVADGSAVCWGHAGEGELGNGALANQAVPGPAVGGLSRAIAVAGGRSGQLGDGSATSRLTPTAVIGLASSVAVAAGGAHTCSLLAGGRISCWGRNDDGQLGDGTSTTRLEPQPVGLTVEAVAITAGGAHSCALTVTGTALCWGRNDDGQLGDGTTTLRRTPTASGRPELLVAIAAGGSHTCAVRFGGLVLCWGDNSRGQLGDGTTVDRRLPTVVVGVANAVAIAAGDFHTCALLADGTARCWGANDSGQIGEGTQTQRSIPVATIAVTNAIGIAAGAAHTCAVKSDGTALCWGDNSRGQLGDGTTTTRSTAAPVTFSVVNRLTGTVTTVPIQGIVQVATGRRHTCAVIVTGAVRCWGENSLGQLGNDTTIDQLRAFTVPSFTLNIVPLVELRANARVATVEIVATCEPAQRLHVDVTVTQGDVSGRGVGEGECVGGIARYPVTVPAQGRDPFAAGPAVVQAQAQIRDGGVVVETQEWTRRVEIENAQ
jgi:alpha-tubulin suppressor-like RCC1 family protein